MIAILPHLLYVHKERDSTRRRIVTRRSIRSASGHRLSIFSSTFPVPLSEDPASSTASNLFSHYHRC